jgi:choline dehydrogenase-like flavoprotein
MAREAVVIGSGAAGSVVAWELARNGWSVTVLERGRNMRPGFGQKPSAKLRTRYGSDEIKSSRNFGFPDPLLEPYTIRTQGEAASGVARSGQGAFGQLGAAVGGTTLHYNAKFPRFWRQDFKMLSRLGPVEGAQVADWPIRYGHLAPYYDEVEARIGVQGDVEEMPRRTRRQSRGKRPFAMPPNPISYVSRILAEAAAEEGWTAYPQPAAVNSRNFAGRPRCNSCGLCSGFGCPINARGDALVSFLNPAVRSGRVRVIPRAFAYRVKTRARGDRVNEVRYVDGQGRRRAISADIYVLAGSPINTARLLLMSASSAHPDGLGNRSGQLGRNMMFHNFTLAAAIFPGDVHPLRSQSNSLELDDLIGPFTGAEASSRGVPYIKGGLVQVGGGLPLLTSASLYAGLVSYGRDHKEAMRLGQLHSKVGGSQLVHEDLPQAENRIDLDPDVRDHHGFPAARITYSPHQHEKAAAQFLGPRMQAWHARASGATGAALVPYPLLGDRATYTAHLAGTARMGDDPESSVCEAGGSLHEVENVFVADASTFPTFPGFNPTNTIMANALRIARGITGGRPGANRQGSKAAVAP